MNDQSWTFDKLMRRLLYIGGIALVFFILNKLSAFLLPFFIALLVAYLLEPFVQIFFKWFKKKMRWLAVIITLLLLVVVLIGISMIVTPLISAEIGKMNHLVTGYYNSSGMNEKIPEFINNQLAVLLEDQNIQELLNADNIGKFAPQLLEGLWQGVNGLTGFLGGLFGVFTFLLYLIFIMLSYSDLTGNWKSLFPPMYRDKAVMLISDIEKEMKVYFRGQAKVVIIVSILFAIGFKAISLPLGILLGITVGLLNFIPYMQMVGMIPAILLAGLKAMEQHSNFWVEVSLVLAVFVIIQAIQEIILNPKILGDAVGLNPAIILLALSVWGGLLGVLGMIIALPITSLIINYYKRFILKEIENTIE